MIAKQVTRTFVRSDNNGIYDVEIDGETISSTYNHEFWIDGFGWIEADELEVGDALLTDDGDFVEVNVIGVREGSLADRHKWIESRTGKESGQKA